MCSTKEKLRRHALPWVFILLSTLISRAQGTAFLYQGALNDGGLRATGTYDLTFTLYDSSNQPGNIIAGTITNLGTGVTNGLFTTLLDFGGAFDGTARWLQIGVRTNGGANFAALSPRQPVTTVPYAIFSGSATNVVGALSPANLAPVTSMIASSSNGLYSALQSSFTSNLTSVTTNISTNHAGGGYATPYDFGAKGDGVTDDTVAVQNWVNFCQTNGVIAFVPPCAPSASPWFKITSVIWITNNVATGTASLVMRGTGGDMYTPAAPALSHSGFLLSGSTGSAFIISNQPSGPAFEHLEFSDFYVQSDTRASTNQYGMAFIEGPGVTASMNNVLINHVGIRNFDCGLWVEGVAESRLDRVAVWGNNHGIWLGMRDNTGCSYLEDVKLLNVAGHGNYEDGLTIANFSNCAITHNIDIDSSDFEQYYAGASGIIINGPVQVGIHAYEGGGGPFDGPEDITIENGANVVIQNSQLGIGKRYPRVCIAVTNATLTMQNLRFSNSSNGVVVSEVQSSGLTQVTSFPPTTIAFSGDNGSTFTTNFMGVAFNGIGVPLATNAAAPSPLPGYSRLYVSNYDLYLVTPTKTNLIVLGH
jgi:hypothetical protein